MPLLMGEMSHCIHSWGDGVWTGARAEVLEQTGEHALSRAFLSLIADADAADQVGQSSDSATFPAPPCVD